MGVAECRTWKQLVLQDEQAEEIVARVRAEVKDSKPRPDKSMRCAPESPSQPRRRDTLTKEVKSPPKPSKSEEEWLLARHVLINHIPSRMSTWPCCLSYSKRVTYSNFQRSDALKRGKTDDPTYYLYHMMLGHPTKNCYIFKDVLQALVDAEVLKLRPEQKKVTANMTATHRFNLDEISH